METFHHSSAKALLDFDLRETTILPFVNPILNLHGSIFRTTRRKMDKRPPTTKPTPFLERLEAEMKNAFFSNEATADSESPHHKVTGGPQDNSPAAPLQTPQAIWNFINSEPSETPHRMQLLSFMRWHEMWNQVSGPLTTDERLELEHR